MEAIISDPGDITVLSQASFQEAILKINTTKSGIALIVDDAHRLRGVLTDGDIRRAILKGIQLHDPVTKAMTADPLLIRHKANMGEVSRIFAEKGISHLPVVDELDHLCGIIYETDLRKARLLSVPVVIMAGGLGSRLMPLTERVPKPMLNVNGKPMIERIIERFRDFGVFEFYISVHYRARVIEEHFGDGSAWSLRIRYLREERPLGTAGSLSLLPEMQEPFFVTNGDVITDLDFRSMYTVHLTRNSDFTMAVKRYEYQVPYGVVELDQDHVVKIKEKPLLKNYVNAGIYVLSPTVLPIVPANTRYDMTDLINALIRTNKRLCSYNVDGPWTDIGEKKEYCRVNGIEPEALGAGAQA